jgi:hypothetical protein
MCSWTGQTRRPYGAWFAGPKSLTSANTLRNRDNRVNWYCHRTVTVALMRETSINTQRSTSAERAEAGDRHSVSDLNNQLYRAYLSGDGAAVERIMALLDKAAR